MLILRSTYYYIGFLMPGLQIYCAMQNTDQFDAYLLVSICAKRCFFARIYLIINERHAAVFTGNHSGPRELPGVNHLQTMGV